MCSSAERHVRYYGRPYHTIANYSRVGSAVVALDLHAQPYYYTVFWSKGSALELAVPV